MSTAKTTSKEKLIESLPSRSMKEVLRGLQRDAKAGGADKLTPAEITREIAAARREKSKSKRPGA
jgi:hypothetical protein